MTVRYVPLTDLEVERLEKERMKFALKSLGTTNDEDIPEDLYKKLRDVIYDYDFTQIILEDDYDFFLTMVADMEDEARHYGED